MQFSMIHLALMLVVQGTLAIVIFKLYRRLGRNPWPPTFYALIPGVGMLAFAIYQVRVLFHIIDRLEALEISRLT